MASGMRLAGKCRGTGGFAALRRIVRGRIGARAGTTTVELALVGPLLIFLLFGIIEFGLILKDVVGVNQTAREGARCAAVGSPPSTITTRIRAAAPTITTANLTTAYAYRRFNSISGTWTAWTTLGTSGTENDAKAGDQIRVSLTYPHQLVTGGLFSGLADSPGTGSITLSTAIIMQRE